MVTRRAFSAATLSVMGLSKYAITTMPTPYVFPSTMEKPAVVLRLTLVKRSGDRVVKLDVWRDGMPRGPRAATVMV